MTNKELFYFTGKCLTLDERPAFSSVILEQIDAGQIDWNKFVWLCSNHLILQVIYLKFKAHNILSELPDHLAGHLKFIHQLNYDRNTAILKQIADITVVLNKENISPVFMKGTGNLLSGLYKDIGERIIGDIDFLVSEENYLKAADILLDREYQKQDTLYPSTMPAKHYPTLFRKDVPADVEIHRAPVSLLHYNYFNAAMVLRDKVSAPTLQSCYVPSDEHKIIQNFIHSQFDHQGYQLARVSFRDLYDLHLLSLKDKTKTRLTPMPYPRKALNYFTLAEKILGSKHHTSLFCFKFDLYQQFPILNKILVYIPNRIYSKYIRNLYWLLFNKDERPRLINRLNKFRKMPKS